MQNRIPFINRIHTFTPFRTKSIRSCGTLIARSSYHVQFAGALSPERVADGGGRSRRIATALESTVVHGIPDAVEESFAFFGNRVSRSTRKGRAASITIKQLASVVVHLGAHEKWELVSFRHEDDLI